MSEPRIERIELTPLYVPFRAAVREAMAGSEGGLGMALAAEEAWLGGDFAICRLIADDGSVGLGEAFVWLPETGVSPEQLIDVVREALAAYVLGESPFDVSKIRHRMDRNVARSDIAKGLLDMACYDLMGQIAGRPAHDFMGGRCADAIPLTALIPLLSEASDMVEMAQAFASAGTTSFRFKLGRSIDEDLRIISLAREKLGHRAKIRVDYNQAYSPLEAVSAIRAIEPYGIECAEQPVGAEDHIGMVRVQSQVRVPLMAHEGCFSLLELVDLIELGAVGIVGINTERPGGISHALQAIDYATRRSMGVVIHNQPLGIASAAQIHLAAARWPVLGHAIELFGHVMLEDDLIGDSLEYSNGQVVVPEGPGLGVELDEAALEKYATAPATVIEAKS